MSGNSGSMSHNAWVADSFYLAPGQSVESRSGVYYRCIQVLGMGGNAVTFLVCANGGPHKGLLFALKVFKKLSKKERRDSFLKEMDFLKTCDHPAIMRLYDDGLFSINTDRQHPFVVAEYLPRTLEAVRREGSAGVVQKVSYALQMLSALVYLDSLNPKVVHRDIKPQNVFVKGASCVIGDFGLMKTLDDEEELDREIFKESTGPGMPFFFPTPDLVDYAKNVAPLTTKTDVYQLGLTLAFLFTGSTLVKQPREPYGRVMRYSIPHLHGESAAGIVALLNRMLIPNPVKRPSAAALMDGWRGVFDSVVASAIDLEGRAF